MFRAMEWSILTSLSSQFATIRRSFRSWPQTTKQGSFNQSEKFRKSVGFDSETMLMALDLEGVCASSGSACMVGSVVASHVLLAMGLSMERASSAVRFSLGKQTSTDEIDRAGDAIDRIFNRLAKTKTKSSAYAVA